MKKNMIAVLKVDSLESSHGSRSNSMNKKNHLNIDMTETEKIDTLNKIYNSKNTYIPIDQKSHSVKEIYREML